MTMDFQDLCEATREGAAFRRTSQLQPVGGRGDKLFPPTYPGERREDPPRHVFERRRIDDSDVWCVLIDSVQSQANRLEEALLETADGNDMGELVPIPYATVDFRGLGLEPLERITSLDAPHRVYDAIFRDSLLNGLPFMQTADGQLLASAKPADATALLERSPNALVFGAWHSQGQGGGIGAKFPRTVVSEIVGIDTPVEAVATDQRNFEQRDRTTGRRGRKEWLEALTLGELSIRTAGRRTGSRIDPLGILRNVEVFKGPSGWDTNQEAAGTKAKKVRPSEINHSNVAPSIEALGVTCAHVEHRTTITLAGIRRLRFGGGQRDTTGRALVAALGLLAMKEQDSRGYALRSRCDLVCEGTTPLELVSWDGSSSEVYLDLSSARALYLEAYHQAMNAGFAFRCLKLKPQDKLVKIVRRSRELALEGNSKDEETGT